VTKYPELFAALSAPFQREEVKERSAPGGKKLQYITARTVMNRLDSVLGPEAWWDEYLPGQDSVICRLTIVLPDGSTLTKCDAGGYAGMQDSGDDDKSGFSDALKRAAAKFGVARYLYRDGVPTYSREAPPEKPLARELPPSSHPPAPVPRGPIPAASHAPAEPETSRAIGEPTTGKALFAWLHEREEKGDLPRGSILSLSDWARGQDYPTRMIDYTEAMAAAVYAEACRRLEAERSPESLATLRRQVSELATMAATFKAGGDQPTVEQMRAVLKEVSVTHPEGREIYSIKACDDPALLRFYATALREKARFIKSDPGSAA
jgi:hypothetical protein